MSGVRLTLCRGFWGLVLCSPNQKPQDNRCYVRRTESQCSLLICATCLLLGSLTQCEIGNPHSEASSTPKHSIFWFRAICGHTETNMADIHVFTMSRWARFSIRMVAGFAEVEDRKIFWLRGLQPSELFSASS